MSDSGGLSQEDLAKLAELLRAQVGVPDRRPSEDKSIKGLLEQMLEQQAAEEAKKNRRWQLFYRYVAAPIITFIIGGGSLFGYRIAHQDAPDPASPEELAGQAADQAAVRASLPVKVRIVDLESKVRTLGTLAIEQQVQVADGMKYIADKIDKVHPSRAGAVDKPESVQKSEDKAEAIKKARRVDELFDVDDPDPFSQMPTGGR